MKVLIVGNQGNVGWRFGRWLIEEGHSVALYFDFNTNHVRSKPEWESPEIVGNYPKWIFHLPYRFIDFIRPSRTLLKAAENSDVILTSGEDIIKCLKINKPVFVRAVGGDLTRIPFYAGSIKGEIKSYMYRKYSHRICGVVGAQEDIFWAAYFLGIRNVLKTPIPLDVPSRLDKETESTDSDYMLTIVNTCRKNLDSKKVDYKGNEIFLEGLESFIRTFSHSYDTSRIRIIIGMHGNDIELFRALLREIDFMEAKLELVPHLPVQEMYQLFKKPNVVVVDQFGPIGRLNVGGIGREALLNGAPVITATDTKDKLFVEVFGNDCPVLSAMNAHEISDRLMEYVNMSPEDRSELSKQGFLWIQKNYDRKIVVKKLVEFIENVTEGV